MVLLMLFVSLGHPSKPVNTEGKYDWHLIRSGITVLDAEVALLALQISGQRMMYRSSTLKHMAGKGVTGKFAIQSGSGCRKGPGNSVLQPR